MQIKQHKVMNKKVIKRDYSRHFKYPMQIMRVFLLIFFIGINSVSAETYSQEARLSLRLKNVSIEEFFAEIEKNSEYIFFYKETVLGETRITIDVKGKTLPQILDDVLVSRNITYHINDRQVLVIRSSADEKEAVTPSIAQQTKKTITGTVVDKNGETVIGANVVEKGTTNGTITDVNGEFSLAVSENATLQVSFIGYITQEISVLSEGGGVTPLLSNCLKMLRRWTKWWLSATARRRKRISQELSVPSMPSR
jgi:hypothetical protein